MHKQKTL
jgi:hypothetical protein